MPNYRYQATDAAGRPTSGEVPGSSPREAEARLAAEGLTVFRLEEEPNGPSASPLSRRDGAELAGRIADLARSGLPLPGGLRAAAEESGSRPLRAALLDLAERLDRGEGLDEALAATGGRFPSSLRGLVAAGSRSGRLSEVLAESVRQADLAAGLRRQFWTTLAYPTACLVAVVFLVLFICGLAVRTSAALLGWMVDFGLARSSQADALVAMARFLSEHSFEVLLVIFGLPALAWVSATLVFEPADRRRVAKKIPLVGPLLRASALAEFCHLLAILVEADLPLPEALRLAGSGVRDPEVARACGRVAEAVASGQTLSEAALRWEAIPAGLGELFRWSEGHRSLPEALRLAGEMYEARARSQARYSSQVLGALLVLLSLWWIGFAIAALYLPLITSIDRLSG